MDLRANNESWIPDESLMVKPVYCGPGLWYDKQTGLIHCRLAHTQLQLLEKTGYRLPQYRGETDPRKLPLVIAPFASRPLVVDQAMHVRFQDLVIRGGGYVTVDLAFGVGIEFDHCTIYCGTYGIWSKGTGPLKMTHCGVYGMIPPWAFRTENCSYAYSPFVYPPFLEGLATEERQGASTARPKQVTRHIARLHFYQNTMLFPAYHLGLGFTGGLAYGWEPETPRRVFNNIFAFYGLDGKYPILFYGMRRDRADLQIDGDLHWSLTAGQAPPGDFFKPLREHPIAKANLEKYPAGLGAHCLVGDPRFLAVSTDPQAVNDYRLRPDSPAVGHGVPLPAEWPDPLRPVQGPPDICAIPSGGEPLKVGIHGRITAGMLGEPD